jgi:hypothetical protein
MPHRISLLAGLLSCFPLWCFVRPAGGMEDVRQRFEQLDEAKDHGAVVQLWRAHPGESLGVIDSFLEGSLALVEGDKSVDPAQVAALEARAQRGARAADEAFGTSIFSDYAASFAGWNATEQSRFRQGQSTFREASRALRGGDPGLALEKARASWELARPLGDWWGSAMALGLMAKAHATLGQQLEALDCAAQARLIDHDLRLFDAELADLLVMARAAIELRRVERARDCSSAGMLLARQLDDLKSQVRLAELGVLMAEHGQDKDSLAQAKSELARLQALLHEREAKETDTGR